jgi:hypothetical protein
MALRCSSSYRPPQREGEIAQFVTMIAEKLSRSMRQLDDG